MLDLPKVEIPRVVGRQPRRVRSRNETSWEPDISLVLISCWIEGNCSRANITGRVDGLKSQPCLSGFGVASIRVTPPRHRSVPIRIFCSSFCKLLVLIWASQFVGALTFFRCLQNSRKHWFNKNCFCLWFLRMGSKAPPLHRKLLKLSRSPFFPLYLIS